MVKPVCKPNPKSAIGGKREDLNGIYFRSKAEANIARFFNFTKTEWQYEPREFFFDGIRKGSVSYKPDFYLPGEDQWIEVKGWFDSKSITKLKRFKKYYPAEFKKLTLIVQSKKSVTVAMQLGIPCLRYEEIAKKVGRLIKNWE